MFIYVYGYRENIKQEYLLPSINHNVLFNFIFKSDNTHFV